MRRDLVRAVASQNGDVDGGKHHELVSLFSQQYV
jgi:hypothetical protein